MKTQAWIIERGTRRQKGPARLKKGVIELAELGPEDVLVEPIYGCWEANMSHALARDPVDVCRLRHERQVVLGNAGVVRIERVGAKVQTCQVGDICGIVPVGRIDPFGYPLTIVGFDHPRSQGLLAKQALLNQLQVMRLPSPSAHSYQQWACFSVRYTTAWENWRITYDFLQLLQRDLDPEMPVYVFGWGGGTTFAELTLAKRHDCRVAMTASHDNRLRLLQEAGIKALDRRAFPDLDYDAERYAGDREYKTRYLASERTFLAAVNQFTEGAGVSIFVDFIGGSSFRATQRALSVHGIITTAGWKNGGDVIFNRPTACMRRTHLIHTHACRRDQGARASEYAERHGWLPQDVGEPYAWENIPDLARDYEKGKITSYFPLFSVNPE